MNQKRLLSFFLVTAVFLAPVLCPAQGLPNGVQKVTSAEGITEYSLNNGLHFLVFPDPSKPTITVNVTYLVGSRQEGSGEGGMAHLLEHMVFKGSTNHLNIMQELTEHGCRPNGSTRHDGGNPRGPDLHRAGRPARARHGPHRRGLRPTGGGSPVTVREWESVQSVGHGFPEGIVSGAAEFRCALGSEWRRGTDSAADARGGGTLSGRRQPHRGCQRAPVPGSRDGIAHADP